ncbi:hypothetical protein AB0M45_15405 [Nocardia sp. NPDC051787]|uniref:hypothetical protein n=1 Tax=Nocardia sp. NPDC051787 TaxID=3155415 RepID=UPI0034265B92
MLISESVAPASAEDVVAAASAPERLIRLLRESDSATRTLAAWIGAPVVLDVVDRHDDRLSSAEFADLDLWRPEPVQRRAIRLLDIRNHVLSEATATVVLGRLPYSIARALRDGNTPLGLLLAPLHPKRHTLSVVRSPESGNQQGSPLFDITARLDVGGLPVALVRERYLWERLL